MCRALLLACGCFAVLAAVGCRRHAFSTAPVRGVVLCQGRPVTEGTITFSPIPEEGKMVSGKSASATIRPDGTFVLGTYSASDGAIIGRHRVFYSAIGDTGPKTPPPCGYSVTLEVEITSGINDFRIDLSEGRK
jgi:hypothetical protein